MKASVAASILLATTASAFAPMPQQRAFVGRPLAMSDVDEAVSVPAPAPVASKPKKASEGGALVPVKEETVEFTAGILGGVAGLVIGGPLLGVIGAAAANYVSKMDGDATDVVQSVSKTSIEVFNYLANLDRKYEVLENAKKSLQKSLDKLKEQETVDPATISKVENALKNTNAKIKELNDEYDLVGGATTALGVIGDLVEKAIKKAGDLNAEYQLSAKAKESLTKAVDKAKEAAKSAT